jgi:23S rRNA (guanosine2251-2'-O)-methyltransferase
MTNQNFSYGAHTVYALLQLSPQKIMHIWLQENRKDTQIRKIMHLARQHGISIQVISRADLNRLVGHEKHQGMIAQLKPESKKNMEDLEDWLSELKEPPFLLVLDQIQDPHNLGACLRSADAAGVHGVIFPKDRSVSITGIVRKVASGATESLPIFQVTNLARTLVMLRDRDIRVVGADADAKCTLFESKLTGSLAVVMGNEGTGLRRLTKENCDELLSIPMVGTVSSLNVSVATGIFLFEAVRQRTICADKYRL